MARAFGAGRAEMIRKIYLPGAVPMMLAGIRLGLGRGIVAMITAEMFLAVVGVGFLVVSYGNRLQTAEVFALAVFVSVFGVVATRFVGYVGRRLAPWSDDQRV
jgi:NitT/TauT family transport system permease protein